MANDQPIVLNLEDLPIEVHYFHIFKYLHIVDVFRLKSVCKKFYSIASSFDIKELWILDDDEVEEYEKDVVDSGEHWFTTHKSIKLTNQFGSSYIFCLLKKPPVNLLNLKYLRIDDFKEPIKLKNLKKFKKLEILHLYLFRYSPSDYLLKLPELKSLSVRIDLRPGEDLVIDAPKLRSLSLYSYTGDAINDSLVKVINPRSVKYLKLEHYGERVSSIFSRLECLELMRLTSDLTKKDLLKFRKLRKLRIEGLYWNGPKMLTELYSAKKDNLQIVLAGVLIKYKQKIDEYKGFDHLSEFKRNNQDDLEDLSNERFFSRDRF